MSPNKPTERVNKSNLLGNIFILVVCIRTGAAGFSLYDCNLHVLDLYPDQQEVDLAHNHVLQGHTKS